MSVNEFTLSVNMGTRLGRVATSAFGDHIPSESLGGTVDSQLVFLKHFLKMAKTKHTLGQLPVSYKNPF